MNPRLLATLFVCFATGCALGAGVDLELRAPKSQQIVFEPPDLRLILINRGKDALSVAPEVESGVRVRIETPDGWVDCRSTISITPGVGSIQWRRITPGGELQIGLPPFTCPGVGESNGSSFKDWTEVPGRYRLHVESNLVTPSRSADTSAPADAVGGSLTSNTITIEVRAAQGVDAEALKWAAENHHNALDTAVANRFPDSTYAAIVLWKYVSPVLPEPEKVQAALAIGAFPQERAVPDATAPDGWATRAGRELAQWQIETGERILGVHRGFVYARSIRLSMALARIASGKRDQGLSEIGMLGKDLTSSEGRWAAAFLALQN